MDYLFWVIFPVVLICFYFFFYLWWGRRSSIKKALYHLFENPATLLSETVSKEKIIFLQQVGCIFGYTQPKDDLSVFVYRYCIPGAGGRHKYYLGVELIGLNLEHNLYDCVYGSGFAVGHYSDPYSVNKKACALKEFSTEVSVPKGYSIVEVHRKNIVVFYEIPEFFGFGKMKEVSVWVKSM